MGQNNCCQAAESKGPKIKEMQGPSNYDSESIQKQKNLNHLLLFQIYNKLCNELLKILENIKYKYVFYQLSNNKFSNNQQSKIKQVDIDFKQQASSLTNQSNNSDYDSQTFDSSQHHIVVDNKYQSNQNNQEDDINNVIISDTIKLLHSIVTQNNGQQQRGSLTNKLIYTSTKTMESALFSFLQVNKFSGQKKQNKCFDDFNNKDNQEQSEQQKGRTLNKSQLYEFLTIQEIDQLQSLCQRISDTLPSENMPQLQLKSNNTETDTFDGFSPINNIDSQQHITFSTCEKGKPVLSKFHKNNQKYAHHLDVSINFRQEFPFLPNEIISINKKKKQILIVGQQNPTYIIFNRLKDENKLNQKISQLKLHHSLSSKNENSTVLKISSPFNVLKNGSLFLIATVQSVEQGVLQKKQKKNTPYQKIILNSND